MRRCLPIAGLTEIDSLLISPLLVSLPLDFVNSEWLTLVCLENPEPCARVSQLQAGGELKEACASGFLQTLPGSLSSGIQLSQVTVINLTHGYTDKRHPMIPSNKSSNLGVILGSLETQSLMLPPLFNFLIVVKHKCVSQPF